MLSPELKQYHRDSVARSMSKVYEAFSGDPLETPVDKNTKFTFEYFNGRQGTAEKDGYDWRVTWPGGYVAYYTTQQVAGYVDRGEWKLLAATMDEDYALTWTFQK